MRMKWYAAALAVVAVLVSTSASATVISGTITDWVESGPRKQFGDGTNFVSAWWSVGGFVNTSPRAFFYGSNYGHVSDVAYATSVTDVTQIDDASGLTFTSNALATVAPGSFLVFRNQLSGYYGAFRINDISTRYPNLLDGNWWFQTDGTDNFSGRQTSVPEPGSIALLSLGLLVLAVSQRKATKTGSMK